MKPLKWEKTPEEPTFPGVSESDFETERGRLLDIIILDCDAGEHWIQVWLNKSDNKFYSCEIGPGLGRPGTDNFMEAERGPFETLDEAKADAEAWVRSEEFMNGHKMTTQLRIYTTCDTTCDEDAEKWAGVLKHNRTPEEETRIQAYFAYGENRRNQILADFLWELIDPWSDAYDAEIEKVLRPKFTAYLLSDRPDKLTVK